METVQLAPLTDEEAERFWEKVSGGNVDTCWEWQASANRRYGQFKAGGTMRKAHRIAWTILRGDIPTGLTIDHLCFNTLCQNPWHMEPVTRAENARRVRANQHKGKTHCNRGHAFTPDNTRMLVRNRRQCLACERLTTNARRALARAA